MPTKPSWLGQKCMPYYRVCLILDIINMRFQSLAFICIYLIVLVAYAAPVPRQDGIPITLAPRSSKKLEITKITLHYSEDDIRGVGNPPPGKTQDEYMREIMRDTINGYLEAGIDTKYEQKAVDKGHFAYEGKEKGSPQGMAKFDIETKDEKGTKKDHKGGEMYVNTLRMGVEKFP
ncbi:hypothetical protein FB446DRAFT_759061 [Lentinula raphanica]|nr:hypothetical protein FB446DRAFT_759061 [Lentinula raphanica]